MEIDEWFLPPVATLNSVTLIGLTNDGDVGLSVTTSLVRSAGGSGSDGEESGNNELFRYRSLALY